MFDSGFLNILADPRNGESLHWGNDASHLRSSDAEYQINEGVPILLPKEAAIIPEAHELHRRFGTHFDYSDHYHSDAEYFDYFKPYNDLAIDHQFRRIHESILKRVPRNAELILDVGCGSGWVAQTLCKGDTKVVSMDISLANPLKTNRLVNSPNHMAVVADAYNLPFKADSFDCIIASEIIEHVSDPALFIRSLLKALKPGGMLIISTPYNEKINYYLCVHCNKVTPQYAHLNSFNEKNFNQFLPANIAKFDYLIFNNSYLPKLRFHYLFQVLPFNIWQVFDKIANAITNKAICFTIYVEK